MNLPRAVREHVVLLCNVLKAPTFCAFEGVKTIRYESDLHLSSCLLYMNFCVISFIFFHSTPYTRSITCLCHSTLLFLCLRSAHKNCTPSLRLISSVDCHTNRGSQTLHLIMPTHTASRCVFHLIYCFIKMLCKKDYMEI